jgi:ribose transport system substrate-binding protein
MPFSQADAASLKTAAAAVGVDLLVLDNHYDAATAVANAELFIQERVDVIIEFQVEQHAAPIIADKIATAGIPLIAVDIPHPRATYFGVDNYRAGLEAGGILAEFALSHWEGAVDWMVGLDIEEAGPLVQSRITGSFEGVRTRLLNLPVECFVRIDGRGMRDKSYKVVLEFLKRHPKDKHILIAAANDTSAMGALEAVRELKREKHVAIVGQDCVEEMLKEMLRTESPAIASISHDVALYGSKLIELGLALLRGETVPPYNYAPHRVVTADAAGRMLEAEFAPLHAAVEATQRAVEGVELQASVKKTRPVAKPIKTSRNVKVQAK